MNNVLQEILINVLGIFAVLGIAMFIVVRIRNRRARLQCPNCSRLFGRRSANVIKPYCRTQMLDGPLGAVDGCAGKDGFVIHCENCAIDVVFDKKNKKNKKY